MGMDARKLLRLFAVCFFFLIAVGCESVLYYPTDKVYSNPAQYGLKPEDVWFQSEEGPKLHGWYFRAPVSKPRGTFVFFHGNAQNLTSHYVSLIFVLDHGYDFFIFDYQGYGQSEGSPSTRGTVLDGRAAIKLVHARNPELPLFVFAQSLGGAIGMRTVIELKDEIPFGLVVADSTFRSYHGIAEAKLEQMGLSWLLKPLLPGDESAPADLISTISPIPLVVVHGDADTVVEFQFGQEIFATANEPKEFWLVPGGKHIDAFRRHNGVYRQRLLDRLNQLN